MKWNITNRTLLQTRITAIFSDYDGTPCPTDFVRSQENKIPEELEQTLWDISQRIPVCIISSKDFHFLHPKTKFARILSCIMGIETLTFKMHKKEGRMINENIEANSNGKEGCGDTLNCIEDTHLMLNDTKTLRANSSLLARLADDVSLSYEDIIVERKLSSNKQILAGITFDYRHRKLEIIQEEIGTISEGNDTEKSIVLSSGRIKQALSSDLCFPSFYGCIRN